MAERAINRQGRRERARGNTHRFTEEMDKAELKRRSRSEGPSRRIRQSMEERSGKNNNKKDSNDSDDSDKVFQPRVEKIDSDSDSEPKSWTKNPMVVRRVKKGDKRNLEKRYSATENVSRGSWGNPYDASSGSYGGNSSRDGMASKSSSKFQKLEEMRKKRINVAVTSDEEATPASRISRLRQRAIQSGLGENSSNIKYSAPQSKYENKENSSIQNTNINLNNRNGNFVHQTVHQQSQPVPISKSRTQSDYFQTAEQCSHYDNVQNLRQIEQNQPKKFPGIIQLGETPKVISSRPSTSTNSNRQAFFTIPEPHSQAGRSNFSNSPELVPRRIPPARVASNSSAVESKTNINQNKNSVSNIPFERRGSGGFSLSADNSPAPKFNQVVQARIKSNKIERPKSITKIPKKVENIKAADFCTSEDSLDELIEQNMQYLDSEIDKSKSKRQSVINVSRSSSLPDPRKSFHQAYEPASIPQVSQNANLQFHVNLQNESRQNFSALPRRNFSDRSNFNATNSGSFGNPPVMKIAPLNCREPEPNLEPIPRVERKFSYESNRLSRPGSENYDRDDLSKSDSQLNTAPPVNSYFGTNLHPDHAYNRGCVSDANLTTSSNNLMASQIDKGMFSDVEYDIEVSERVKKWEKFMKKKDEQEARQNLSTIQENFETENLMLPSNVRKSLGLGKPMEKIPKYHQLVEPMTGMVSSPQHHQQVVPMSGVVTSSVKPYSSDTALNTSSEPRVFSIETNAHRFFQVIQDPQTGPRLGLQSQSVSSVYHPPLAIHGDTSILTANKLRAKILNNKQAPATVPIGSIQATYQSNVQTTGFHTTDSEGTKTHVAKRFNDTENSKDSSKRASRFQEELEEIKNVKSDTVGILRRRFDTDSAATLTSEDETKVSTASTKLSRPLKISPVYKEQESVDWLSIIPDYENKIKEQEVWSPNLESTQGVPVSIERVKARTLQTIPFSEDPFWKEIEEMTSFDPNSLAGHLRINAATQDLHAIEAETLQNQPENVSHMNSSTLPSHPRNLVSSKERMQRSKSLYTPNITPLTINTDLTQTAANALDDVLDDIRSSMERKQLSPKKKTENELYSSSSSGISNVPKYFQINKDLNKEKQLQRFDANTLAKMRAAHSSAQSKQPIQFYQQQRLQSSQPLAQEASNNGINKPLNKDQINLQAGNRYSQNMQGNVNNYHLDPDLLKQKLLSTGLVEETDTEDIEARNKLNAARITKPYYSFEQHQPHERSILGSNQPVVKKVPSYVLPKHFDPAPDIPPRKNTHAQFNTNLDTTDKLVIKHGKSALDDIQKALAPFQSNYQPGPESLYGTARLDEFSRSGYDTTRGSNTSSTSWSYQSNNPNRDTQMNDSIDSSKRLQEVNDSMDDLKNLAQDVEKRINTIKSRLQSADETSLDSILNSLKRFGPESKTQEEESYENYYAKKKKKLSQALSELDRIYESLDLTDVSNKNKSRQYQPSGSSKFVVAPIPKSSHLRPMQTRISSVYIPGLEPKKEEKTNEETEFDLISKSFQAIVDEVNKTTDMFSRRIDDKEDKTAPEAQKKTFKLTYNPSDRNTDADPSVGETFTPKSNNKSKSGRFKAKLLEMKGNEDENIKKVRSKSVPDIESKTASHPVPSYEASPKLTISTPPLSAKRPRIRPVKDNRIIQEDRSGRKDENSEKLKLPQSPHFSPRLSRRLIYNNQSDFDVSIEPPKQFKDPEKKTTDTVSETFVKPEPILQAVSKIPTILSPPVVRKVPPPVLSKPSVTSNQTSSNILSKISSEIPVSPKTAKSEINIPAKKLLKAHETATTELSTVNFQINVGKAIPKDTEPSAAKTETCQFEQPEPPLAKINDIVSKSKIESTSNTNSCTKLDLNKYSQSGSPKSLDKTGNNKSKAGVAPSSIDTPHHSGTDQKLKKKLGTGVAMLMDRFTADDGLQLKTTRHLSTRSAPDLSAETNEDEKEENIEETENNQLQTEPKMITPKSPVQRRIINNRNGKSPVLIMESSRLPIKQSAHDRKQEAGSDRTGSETSSPSSPISKPPLHPFKRQTSDSIPHSPDISESSDKLKSSNQASSEKRFVSEITSNISSPSRSKKAESSSPKLVVRRVRPQNRKIETKSASDSGDQEGFEKERPRSFHELMHCFQGEGSNLRTGNTNTGPAGKHMKVFSSEPDLTLTVKNEQRNEETDQKKELVNEIKAAKS